MDAVGVDSGLFLSCLFWRGTQDTAQFLRLTPARRAQALSSLVDDLYFRTGHEIAKGRIKELENALGLSNMALLQHQTVANQIAADLAGAEAAATSWERQEQARIQDTRVLLERLMLEMTGLSQALMEARQYSHDNEMARISSEYTAAATDVKELELRLHDIGRSIRELPSGQYLEQYREACPTCSQPISGATLAGIEAKRAGLKFQEGLAQKELASKRAVLQATIETLERIRANTSQVPALERRLDELHQTAALKKEELDPRSNQYLEAQISELRRRSNECALALATTQHHIGQILSQLEIHKAVSSAFNGEVRNLMFDLIRGPLEQWTHYYMEQLCDTGLTVQFPHQDAREKFEILVWNGGTSQELSQYSGGELWRITIAIMLAFRAVLRAQTGCKLDFLMMDDFAGELDQEGIAQALLLLGKLTPGEISTILMTIPRDEFLPAGYYTRMVVTRKGRTAHVA